MSVEPLDVDECRLIEVHYVRMRRFAAVVGPLEVEPDDLVQEALLRTLQRGPLISYDDLGAYLRRTILHLALNHRRTLGRRRRALTRLAATVGNDEPSYRTDLFELLRLPPDTRAVLYLADVERYSFSEIAEMLGCSEAAARARASRGRRRLRAELGMEVSE